MNYLEAINEIGETIEELEMDIEMDTVRGKSTKALEKKLAAAEKKQLKLIEKCKKEDPAQATRIGLDDWE